ncbi:L,D-transpeptidase family protein [Flavobacterium rakeshii]|uniref:L,D-transpeptidase family protein n=1 Tax=Flavobacterium rakeshii TaxID=1038845 RepID=UPI002E7B8009|nr:L,D-transpeptidase family protein [Flavobacterium rakeshii]MEE1896897.1 L,D-transpeptidase family protein [Flavobacterium rakeshii]
MKLRRMILLAMLSVPVVLGVYYFLPEKALPKGGVVDRLVVYKSKRKMLAYNGDTLLKTYTISLGKNPLGHKQFEGDNKTPEGVYNINERNPNSAYHKNLGVSYPNVADREFAEKQGKSPGGLIKIHGLRNDRGYIGKFHRWKDWTAGCIAVTDEEIDELYIAVKENAVIQILP